MAFLQRVDACRAILVPATLPELFGIVAEYMPDIAVHICPSGGSFDNAEMLLAGKLRRTRALKSSLVKSWHDAEAKWYIDHINATGFTLATVLICTLGGRAHTQAFSTKFASAGIANARLSHFECDLCSAAEKRAKQSTAPVLYELIHSPLAVGFHTPANE